MGGIIRCICVFCNNARGLSNYNLVAKLAWMNGAARWALPSRKRPRKEMKNCAPFTLPGTQRWRNLVPDCSLGAKLMRTVLVTVLAVLALWGCDDKPLAGAHWKVIGGTSPPGMQIAFIEIDPKYFKHIADYNSAVEVICLRGAGTVAFFLPGDRIPASGSTRDFFAAGGWSNYSEVVLAWCNRSSNDRYTKWDCDRAGADDAPDGALCGQGVKEAYDALMSLGVEIGMANACGWKPAHPEDRAIANAYLESVANIERRAKWMHAFTPFANDTTGPDDRQNCRRLRPEIERRAAAARKLLATKNK